MALLRRLPRPIPAREGQPCGAGNRLLTFPGPGGWPGPGILARGDCSRGESLVAALPHRSDRYMDQKKSVLSRVLDEVKAAESRDSATTSHNSYASGVFESNSESS